MDDKLKKLMQAEMMEEAERIIEEVNADPALKDVKVPEGMRDKLFAKIRAYEEHKALEQLSDEHKELIRLGKKYKKRRKRVRRAVIVSAVVAVLALGIVSVGEDKNIFGVMSRLFSGGDQEMVDSESIEPIMCIDEEEAYEKIEDLYDVSPVKLENLPEDMVFYEAQFYTDIQCINMIYEVNSETSIVYVIRPNYREASLGMLIEDEKVQEYQMIVNNVAVTMIEYNIKGSGQNRWAVSFIYQDVQYLLRVTNMKQEEVERIVKDLHFLG